ncbi:DUF72 domain-containing protein [Chitinophaga filiformis]|uniref:DUF72 domain-containing protein n=1 Tax=Chitinophaga filiformis TaxID=104663 RepID=UPI001F1B8A4A|nr:DUF72 domain-containing protein [Chitinophaga filiformis]MCF6402917.1 DUF72 domain-containing protein [Chitinophaga filiformis]
MNTKGKFYSGTSGLVLPVANKLAFPPAYKDKSRLSYYASMFNSLEVNSSFYKVPMPTTTRRWATEVPEDFKFTFKLFKGITHNKELVFEEELVQKFMHVIDQVGDKKGALLVQFPAGIHYDSCSQLERLLSSIRQCDPKKTWDLCIEFRHMSWYQKETYKLLKKYHAAMVMHDMPKSLPPQIASRLKFEYVRFHGPAGDYKGGYTDEVLQVYADKIDAWLKEGKTVYVYFNNTIGDALKNLIKLTESIVK